MKSYVYWDAEVAATDAVFVQLAMQQDRSAELRRQARPSPIGDYVRELQEEFESQEDEAEF